MDIVIYKIICPISKEVRYVGKTVNLKRRIYQHTCESSFKKNRHLSNWIKKLKTEKHLKPIFEIIEICDSSIWKERECFWISHYKEKGFKLCNHTLGGDGCHGRKMSEYLKNKISITHKGKRKLYKCIGGVKKHTKESKEKISNSKKGVKIKGKEVFLIDNNGIVTYYNTITEASLITGIKITAISNNLKGYSKKTKIGLWKYKTI